MDGRSGPSAVLIGYGTARRYVAYLPFEVAPGASLATPAELTVQAVSTKLERLIHIYAVTSGPFATADAAAEQLHKLRAAVTWLALEYRVGIKTAKELGSIVSFDAPTSIATNPDFAFLAESDWEYVDGHYEAER